MRAASVILVALVAAGCSAPLSQAGREVRVMTSDAMSRCTRVGSVAGTGANGGSTAENERNATDEARNRAAELGGNAIAITSREVTPLFTKVRAEAYRCPTWDPVPGLAPR
jgi:hypothetical protein